MGCFGVARDSNIPLQARPHARHEKKLRDCLLCWERSRPYMSKVHLFSVLLFSTPFLPKPSSNGV